MTWVRIDDSLPQHPKVIAVSLPARWAYLSSICYSSQHGTDGHVLRSALPFVFGTPKIAAELVEAGLWETDDRGWKVHDYLAYQYSREDRRRRSEVYKANGKLRGKQAANDEANSSAKRSDVHTPSRHAPPSNGSHPGETGESVTANSSANSSPVDEWLLGLPAKDRRDPGIRRDFGLLLNDYPIVDVNEAITAVKRAGELPYPSIVTQQLLTDHGDNFEHRKRRYSGGHKAKGI